MFFDSFPRFYDASATSSSRGRLNLRYEAIFGENRDVFAGARVLDLASHDGRWSLAALKTGAAEVVGIEARENLAAAARANLREYGEDERRVRFLAGDLFTVLGEEALQADVVLCLGFLYHTLRYGELLRKIRDLAPRYFIVDTNVIPLVRRPWVRIANQPTDRQRNAAEDAESYAGRALVGTPSIPALSVLLETYDFEIERFSDWAALIRDNPDLKGVGGYAVGRRITARCISTA
jgi:SAM-dependent methyltransferase